MTRTRPFLENLFQYALFFSRRFLQNAFKEKDSKLPWVSNWRRRCARNDTTSALVFSFEYFSWWKRFSGVWNSLFDVVWCQSPTPEVQCCGCFLGWNTQRVKVIKMEEKKRSRKSCRRISCHFLHMPKDLTLSDRARWLTEKLYNLLNDRGIFSRNSYTRTHNVLQVIHSEKHVKK